MRGRKFCPKLIYIFSSDSFQLFANQKNKSDFCRGLSKDHSYWVSSKSTLQLRKRCRLNLSFTYRSDGNLVQQTGTILGIVIVDHLRSFLLSFIKISNSLEEEMSLKLFCISNSSGHLVQESGRILPLSNRTKKDHSYRVSLKLIKWLRRRCHLEKMILKVFLF